MGKKSTFSFVIDGSGSINTEGWKLVKNFTTGLVSKLLALNSPTLSLFQFSDRSFTEVKCGQFTGNTVGLLQHIKQLIQIRSGTNIANAVIHASNYVLNTLECHQNRKILNKVMFVITDADVRSVSSSKDSYTQVKKAGFTIYAIVVASGVNKTELLDLASDHRKIFLVQKFTDLEERVVQAVYNEVRRFDCGKFLFSISLKHITEEAV